MLRSFDLDMVRDDELEVDAESPEGEAVADPVAVKLEGLLRSLLVLLPLLRLRDLMTFVLSEIGRGRPFILKKRAHALQRMCVLSCDLRQRGVICAAQVKRISPP
ncbi:BQ2448_3790 [Microbotryum intermedium]|uniref:BQ2448_3790 protein n=1 Tax=Microbotryum intermedium TaxID=269621 RepID=A0A238FIL6_9BASI|nr:BQ2448_3790 [Microbotryum intermedium]